jgi:hypothetical protein
MLIAKLPILSNFFLSVYERGLLNMHHEQSTGTHSIMHSEPMSGIWEFLTEEQKKKIALMKVDMKIQLMEIKINDMEKMIELKKKAIADIRKVQEMVR